MVKNDDTYVNKELTDIFNNTEMNGNTSKRHNSSGGDKGTGFSDTKYEPQAASKTWKWIYTILLLGLAPYTLLLSLFFIKYVWTGRFLFARNRSSKIKSRKKNPRNAWKVSLLFVFIIGLILYKPVSESITLSVNSNNANQNIRDIAEHSGFNNKGKLLFYRAHPELVNANTINSKCPTIDQTTIEYGCYLPQENKMYILEVVDSNYKEAKYTTAAHETLHAAYVHLDSAERSKINSLINEFYNDTSNTDAARLHETLKPYGTDINVVNNELHSFIGSETTNVSSSLFDYYTKYFSDRNVAVQANITFNNKIDSKKRDLETEYNNLASMISGIDNYKIQHLDNIKSAMRLADYYGDNYSYNQNVDAYNHNLIYYNSQVDLYNSKRLDYNNKVDTFNAILRSFYPTTTQLNTIQH